LIVASVQESIDRGRAVEETGPAASRDRLQTVTLLDAIREHRFDAAFGGARRDEERARAKERVFSFRDRDGQWEPRAQRPELWNLFNGMVAQGGHVRVFPLSNWTELDIWRYIGEEQLELPSIYFDAVIEETAITRITERGATRADDRTSEAAMEDRKREGYF
jgi:sulfate adenylyltransferase subunit 2